MTPVHMARPMRLLFITATRIGNAILSTGALDRLLAEHPGARITVAGGPLVAPLFEGVPGLDRFIPMPKRRAGGHWWALWRQVVGTRWDRVVDLRGSLIGGLVRCRRWDRWPGGESGPTATHRVDQIARWLAMAPPPMPRLFLSDRQRQAGRDWLMRHGLALPDGASQPFLAQPLLAQPFLALGPAANWIGKQWPVDRFAALATRLVAPDGPLPGARIALFGAPHERAVAADLARRIADRPGSPPVLDGFDLGDLGAVGAVLAEAALYVGNDSGLMHLAAAGGAPTLGLFGPSPDTLYAPRGPWVALARTDEDFRTLERRRYADPAAIQHLMDGLPVERAFAAATTLLARRSGAPSQTGGESIEGWGRTGHDARFIGPDAAL